MVPRPDVPGAPYETDIELKSGMTNKVPNPEHDSTDKSHQIGNTFRKRSKDKDAKGTERGQSKRQRDNQGKKRKAQNQYHDQGDHEGQDGPNKKRLRNKYATNEEGID